MNTDLTLSSNFLAHGELHRLSDGGGTLVQCLGGTLWLTQENDPRDIVLERGDEAVVESDGTAILSALSDARFVLSHRPLALDVVLRARQAQAALAAY